MIVSYLHRDLTESEIRAALQDTELPQGQHDHLNMNKVRNWLGVLYSILQARSNKCLKT